MKTTTLKSCFIAAVLLIFQACSPDETSVKELDKISQSDNTVIPPGCDQLTFDNNVVRDAAGFVTSATSAGGATIGVLGIANNSTANRANLFNTNEDPVSGSNDTDLANKERGNVLIMNGTSTAGVPDDYTAGGTITLDFSSLGSVTLNSVQVFDNEETGTQIKLYDAAYNLITTIDVPQGTDAGIQTINLGNTEGVVYMEFITNGSGAIDDIVFCPEPPKTGCTRTFGYWKTHSKAGPAPYDATWQSIGPLEEQTIFFLSGKTYLAVLQTPVEGNGYYSLAHQYIATKLNLESASAPEEVEEAFEAATALFNTYTPAQVAADKTLNAQFKALVGILDAYNNGLTGPNHCDDDDK
jgi:hypothetical protein